MKRIQNHAQKTTTGTTNKETTSETPTSDLVTGFIELLTHVDELSYETPDLMTMTTLLKKKDFLLEKYQENIYNK